MAEYDAFLDLDDEPLGETAAAVVRRVRDPAETRFDGVVAAKFRKDLSEDSQARFAREMEVGRHLNHPNVMPVLRWSELEGWFTMPVAEYTLERARPQNTDELTSMFADVCAGLEASHSEGFVHRDVKPSNVLWVDDRWVVGDWGLVRRPRGETTYADRTKTGAFYGTESWAAPEQFSDAHEVTAAADIYALGCLLGWAISGEKPTMMNPPTIPADHPLFQIVRKATQQGADRRYQTIAEFREAFERVVSAEAEPASVEHEAERLSAEIEAAADDSAALASAALRLARLADESDSGTIFVDCLARVPAAGVDYICQSDRALAIRLAERMGVWVCELDWGWRDFNYASTPMRFILDICRFAAQHSDHEMLAIAADALFAAEDAWHRFATQNAISAWLGSVRDDAVAAVIATAIRSYPRVIESVGPTDRSRLAPALRAVF